MSNKFSLDKLRDDPDFAAMFAKKATDIRKNKADLLEAARSYQSKYSEEIAQGTIKRQVMLTEGKAKGLKIDEIFQDNELFIPADDTPILNYLFFLLRETKFRDLPIPILRQYADANKDIQLLKEEYEKKYGAEVHKDHNTPEEVPNMVSFIYKNVGDDTMTTLKKLKTLSMSENEKEAFVAFRKGREMCVKYNLAWDQIPYNR